MRPFSIINVEQRSADWLAARAGRLCGSNAGDAVKVAKESSSISKDLGVKEVEARRVLRYKLALERVTGRSFEKQFSARSTASGIEREPLAAAAFEAERNECVFHAGFFQHDALMTGYSPDGFLGDVDELIELKCFEWKEHLAALASDTLDKDIQAQVLHGMWLTGAKAAHVVFFNPDFHAGARLKIVTMKRKDKAYILASGQYESRAEQFLLDTEKAVDALQSLNVAETVVA